jgi:hypothetical protein
MNEIFRTRFFDSHSGNRKSKIQNRKWVGLVAIAAAFALCGAVVETLSAELRVLKPTMVSWIFEQAPVCAMGCRTIQRNP